MMGTSARRTLVFVAAAWVLSCGGAAVAPTPAAPIPAAQCPSPSAVTPVVTCPAGATWNGSACAAPLLAEPNDFDAIAAAQASANSKDGARHVPARDLPVPTADVSSEEQAMIAHAYNPRFAVRPKDAAAWKALAAEIAEAGAKRAASLAAKLRVTIASTTMAGVPCFVVTPESIPPRNRNRLLVNVHGGGYVFDSGLSGTREAVLLAGFGGFKVIAIDYRMPPDSPYPAALDDAMAVWKQAVTMAKPRKMALFGNSTGGALTLAMVLRAKAEHLPLPAAIAPGTPWSDLGDTGDSYRTNEWIDSTLVTANGWLGAAARLYAGDHDLKDPYLSPIYGDFQGFPPAILTTGTRDLFLSNTVRTHRKLRRAGIEAELHVYEGQSHAQFYEDADVPETQEAMTEISAFFDRHLGH